MTVKYRGKEYKLPIKFIFIIEYYQMILRLKRAKRWCNRIFKENKHIHMLPLIALILIILTIIPLVELGIYKNYFDAVMDFKDSILITIIGTFIYNIYNIYYEWHNKMILQYDIYYDFMCECEMFIYDILKIEGYKCRNINFIDRTLIEQLKIKKVFKGNFQHKKEFINERCEELIEKIKDVRRSFIQNKLVGLDLERYNEYMKKTIELIKKYKTSKKNVKEIINEIVGNLYILVSLTRWPWRWDYMIDKKIRKIIKENKIGNLNQEIFDCLEYYDNEEYYDIE